MAEAAAVDRAPFVDAHVHLWDRGRLRYPWLDEPANAAIASSYLVADYRREAAAWNLAGCVHVEAGAHPDDGEAETAWLEEVAAADGLPTAIVARVELDDPAVAERLAFHAARPRVRGIRHLVNWHPHDAGRRAYHRDLVDNPAWRHGYARLGDHGFSFDFHGFPPQLPGLVDLAGRHPEVPLVLDHLALPIVADGLDGWRDALHALARMPHVAVKLSGGGFVATPFAPERFRDLVLEVLDLFGPQRLMVATNFPTDRLFAGMDRTLQAYEDILAGTTAEERRDLWGRNAVRFYRLGIEL